MFWPQPETLDSSRHLRRKLPAPPLKGNNQVYSSSVCSQQHKLSQKPIADKNDQPQEFIQNVL